MILGYAADGREVLFAYQFAGATSEEIEAAAMALLLSPGIRDLRSRLGDWLEGTSHTQAQNCVHLSMWTSMCRKA